MSESTIITTVFIIYVVSWLAFLIATWVWSELKEVKSDAGIIRFLLEENKELKERLDGIERVMMKNGYRPPNKK